MSGAGETYVTLRTYTGWDTEKVPSSRVALNGSGAITVRTDCLEVFEACKARQLEGSDHVRGRVLTASPTRVLHVSLRQMLTNNPADTALYITRVLIEVVTGTVGFIFCCAFPCGVWALGAHLCLLLADQGTSRDPASSSPRTHPTFGSVGSSS